MESMPVGFFNITYDSVVLKQCETIGTVNMIEQVVNIEQENILVNTNALIEHLKPLIENISSDLTKDERSRFENLIVKYQIVGLDGELGQATFAADQNIIRSSENPWSSPICLVKKSGGS
jgi:hypothetical protein